jgi:hypothetical protein
MGESGHGSASLVA